MHGCRLTPQILENFLLDLQRFNYCSSDFLCIDSHRAPWHPGKLGLQVKSYSWIIKQYGMVLVKILFQEIGLANPSSSGAGVLITSRT